MKAHVTGGGEAAALQGRRAGFVSRVLAGLIDLGLLWLIGLGAEVVASVVRYVLLGPPFVLANLPPALLTPVSGVVAALYLIYFWSSTGRTPGQHVFGLRVVDREGRRVRVLRAAVRAVLCLVFPIGLLWVLVSHHNASLQDLVVRSAVVYDWAHRPVER